MLLSPLERLGVSRTYDPALTPLHLGTVLGLRGYHGAGVTVAVLGTGVDTEHPCFAGGVVSQARSFVEAPSGVTGTVGPDTDGQGTFLAGCIAGTLGLSPLCHLLVARVTPHSSVPATPAALAAALYWAANAGAQVALLPWNMRVLLRRRRTARAVAVVYDALRYAKRKGVLLVTPVDAQLPSMEVDDHDDNDDAHRGEQDSGSGRWWETGEPRTSGDGGDGERDELSVLRIGPHDGTGEFALPGGLAVDFLAPGLRWTSASAVGERYATMSGASVAAALVAALVARRLAEVGEPRPTLPEVVAWLRAQVPPALQRADRDVYPQCLGYGPLLVSEHSREAHGTYGWSSGSSSSVPPPPPHAASPSPSPSRSSPAPAVSPAARTSTPDLTATATGAARASPSGSPHTPTARTRLPAEWASASPSPPPPFSASMLLPRSPSRVGDRSSASPPPPAAPPLPSLVRFTSAPAPFTMTTTTPSPTPPASRRPSQASPEQRRRSLHSSQLPADWTAATSTASRRSPSPRRASLSGAAAWVSELASGSSRRTSSVSLHGGEARRRSSVRGLP